ncbi:MAG: hypothetical protein Q9222_000611 [Ikaeria aurantiellina]
MPDRDFSNASHSTTLSEGIARALVFAPTLSRPPSTVPSESPSELLRRQLSVRSVVSTTSSFAERMNRARPEGHDFSVIGLGSCGTVLEIPGTELAIKKGNDVKSMWNDFQLTNRVHNAITETREMIQDAFPTNTIPRSPRCHSFRLPSNPEFWKNNLERFPSSHRSIGAAFHVDRILPLPRSIREALIDLYFAEEEEEEAKQTKENKACLVRLYLGENERAGETYDTLLNFPLRLNMIENLGLEKEALAEEMAITLATVHWEAQVDAMDIEFVLGSATSSEKRRAYQSTDEPHDVDELDFTMRQIHLWVLDFDKSTAIKLDAEDVKSRLVPAFLGNDPYYPRPDLDEELWKTFTAAYLKTSRLILKANL